MPCLEVKYVSTYTDAAGGALTVYRTELQVLEFDGSLISFLERQRLFDFFDKRRHYHNDKEAQIHFFFGHHYSSFEMKILRVSVFRFGVSVRSYLLHLKESRPRPRS